MFLWRFSVPSSCTSWGSSRANICILPATLESKKLFPGQYLCYCSVSKSCLQVVSNSLQPNGLQHARLLWPRVCSNSCLVSQGCHPTISSSVVPFSSYLQSFQPSIVLKEDQLLLAKTTSNCSLYYIPTFSGDLIISIFRNYNSLPWLFGVLWKRTLSFSNYSLPFLSSAQPNF